MAANFNGVDMDFLHRAPRACAWATLRHYGLKYRHNDFDGLIDELYYSSRAVIIDYCATNGWGKRERSKALKLGLKESSRACRDYLHHGLTGDVHELRKFVIDGMEYENDNGQIVSALDKAVDYSWQKSGPEKRLEMAKQIVKRIKVASLKENKFLPKGHPKSPKTKALTQALISICLGESIEVACADAGIKLYYTNGNHVKPSDSVLRRSLRRLGVIRDS